MTHVRASVRAAAAVLIGKGTPANELTTTGSNVFTTRLFPLKTDSTPCWVVTTDDEEDVETDGMGGQQSREMSLIFSGFARSTTGDELEDTLDTMAEELESVMTPSALSGSGVKLLALDTTEFDFDVDETDQAFGMITLTFKALYYTVQGAPGTAI